MHDLYSLHSHSGSDLLERHRSPPRAPGGEAQDLPLRRQLDEARSLACKGELQSARGLCAEVVLEHQFRLHDNRELLRRAIATLLQARGFQLLSRLLLAVDGRRVRIELDSGAARTPAPQLVQRSERDGTTFLAVKESLFRDPSCNAIIDRLSDELLGARTGGFALGG